MKTAVLIIVGVVLLFLLILIFIRKSNKQDSDSKMPDVTGKIQIRVNPSDSLKKSRLKMDTIFTVYIDKPEGGIKEKVGDKVCVEIQLPKSGSSVMKVDVYPELPKSFAPYRKNLPGGGTALIYPCIGVIDKI
jgi:hypothetical protein